MTLIMEFLTPKRNTTNLATNISEMKKTST